MTGRRIGALALALVTCAVFARAWGYGLANIDDYLYVWRYAEVTDGLSLRGLRWALTFTGEAIWMPLVWASYQLDFSLAGWCGADAATVHHVHSVLLHALNAVLVLRLLARLGPKGDAAPALTAFFAALFWAIHPLRVESVVWIASRKDLLSLTGLVLALTEWTDWRRAGGAGRYVRSLAWFAVGALAKPSVMTYPALVGALDVLVLGVRREVRSFVPAYVAPCALGGAVALAGTLVQAVGGGTAATAGVPFGWRVLNAVAGYGIQLWHTLVPWDLAVQCTLRYPAWPRFLLPGAALTAAVGWWAWRRRSGGIAFFTAGILPMLGLVGFGFHAFADRFTYIPAIGLSLVAAEGLARVADVRLRAFAGAAGAVALGALCVRQVGFWEDDRTLFAHTCAVDGPLNANAHFELGRAEWELGHDVTNAVAAYAAAFRADPETVLAQPQHYMFALAEGGFAEEAFAFKKELDAWNARTTAAAREARDEAEVLRPEYALARIAFLLSDPATRRGGAAELEEYLAQPRRTGTRDGLYLKGWLRALEGRADEARRIWSALPDGTVRTEDPYMRYRFLGRR